MDYEELLEKAREAYENEDTPNVVKAWLLANIIRPVDESEDERIRKELIEQIAYIIPNDGEVDNEGNTLPSYQERINKYRAWLEKQGEQKQTWKPNAGQLIVIKDLIEDKNTSKVNKVILHGMLEQLQGLCDVKHEIEKQGKQQDKSALEAWKDMRLEVYQQASGNRHEPNYSDDGTKMFSLNDIDEIIEKISEQKSAGKVEPKFKVGDWIISNDKKSTYQVIEVKRGIYVIRDNVDNHEYHIGIEECEKSGRLWSINDAKDGDVLSNGKMIVIFKHFEEPSYRQHIVAYIGLDISGNIQITDGIWSLGIDAKPATKEQRDLLFQKMWEAGCEWDTEKKELEKIESKFHLGDWVILNNTVAQILDKQKYGFVGLDINGKDFFCNYGHTNAMRLWTIADAKDGDVLVTEDYIFIFKYILHGGVHLYCHYNIDDEEFDSDIPDAVIGNIRDKGTHFHPATKEQRDLLFCKMHDAGYAWDSEKKEPRKINPMNYYAKGDAVKAEQIKAAFENLGCDVTGFDMCNDNILFFTYKLPTGANVISTTNANLYPANIIKTHPDYQELELPVKDKDKVGNCEDI